MLSSSPKLFAANHVLHRLLPPRHSPSALCSLTKKLLSPNDAHPRVSPRAHAICTDTPRRYGLKKRFNYQRPHLACSGPAALEERTCELHRRHWSGSAPATFRWNGGADRDRTDDLRLAKPALSQLSYSPKKACRLELVGLDGFEPSTSRLSGGRSNQLSYRPIA